MFLATTEADLDLISNRFTVTGNKMTLFAKYMSLRPKKRAGRRRPGEEARTRPTKEGEVVKTISSATRNQIVAAIVDLWTQQREAGVNSNPHPREGIYQAYRATVARQKRDKAHREFEDRGLGEFVPKLRLPEPS